MYAYIAGELREMTLLSIHEEVLPGICWGAFDELLTPAYWHGQAWQHTESGTFCDFRLVRSLDEEVAALRVVLILIEMLEDSRKAASCFQR
jgi:hypothetical protein